MNIQIAKTAHAVHRAYCQEMGMKTQPKWHEISPEHRQTVIDSVSKIMAGEMNSPKESHQNFVDRKIADGWTFGEYSLERKTNPRLVNFESLEKEDRMKEILFFECVKSFF